MKRISPLIKKPGVIVRHLFTVNDAPHDIALGFGLGVFLGILPGTGPVAALVCAQFLRANRAAAFFGALVTNTWFSLVVLGLSVQIGARLTGVDLASLSASVRNVFQPFHWDKIAQLPFARVLLPLFTGFAVISVTTGILAYFAAFAALHLHKRLKPPKPQKTE